MISAERIVDAIDEFYQEKDNHSRWQQYVIHEWNDDGKIESRQTVSFPILKNWSEDPPPEESKRNELLDLVIHDDDVPLIESRESAGKAFELLLKNAEIESARGEQVTGAELKSKLHRTQATGKMILPLVGASFDDQIQLTDELTIRPVSSREKELIMNKTEIGAGSFGVSKSIMHGDLTHAAIYESSFSPNDEWHGGLQIMSNIGGDSQEKFESLENALRLSHTERILTGARYSLDETFYPEVYGTSEKNRAGTFGSFGATNFSNTDELKRCFHLISNLDEDEGIRVALERLESAFRHRSHADNVLDSIIGIEALISSGNGGSFREVRRRVAVLSGDKSTYSELGHLQSLRNSTAHGDDTNVEKGDVLQARELLSTLIIRILEIKQDKGILREKILTKLDETIEAVIEDHFEEVVSEFGED